MKYFVVVYLKTSVGLRVGDFLYDGILISVQWLKDKIRDESIVGLQLCRFNTSPIVNSYCVVIEPVCVSIALNVF